MKRAKYYTSAEWAKLYADGTVTKWLQQVTDFFALRRQHRQPGAGDAVLRSARSTCRPSRHERRR